MYRILTVVTLITVNFSFAQNEDCWRCLIAASKGEEEKAQSLCDEFVKTHKETKSAELAQFILASTLLREGAYSDALKKLEQLRFEGSILNAFAVGLQGDCYSELKKEDKAIKAYVEAAKTDVNRLSTPYFLHKAIILSKSLGQFEQMEMYANTVVQYFPGYTSQKQISKYQGNSVSNKLELDFPETTCDYMNIGYGAINGTRVPDEEFLKLLSIAIENENRYAIQNNSMPKKVDLNQVWSSLVNERVTQIECGKLGIIIGEEEFQSYLLGEDGFRVMSDLAAAFVDSQGNFDKGKLLERIEEMKTSDDPKIQEMWQLSKNYYIQKRLREKILSTISLGFYITQVEKGELLQSESESKSILYIIMRYTSKDDQELQVTEEELRRYFEEHKTDEKYKSRANSRGLLFADFSLKPRKSDTLEFIKGMEALKDQFEQSKNDSMFVMEHSETKRFSSSHRATYFSDSTSERFIQNKMPVTAFNTAVHSEVGDVIGPYEYDNKMCIAKILGFNEQRITARHILIGFDHSSPESKQKAELRVNDIMKEINHDNFERFVYLNSEDPGSRDNGGVYEDFLDFYMVEPFANYSYNEPIGKIGVVETQFGFHIMEVLERKPVKYPVLAIVDKSVVFSEESKIELRNKIEGKIKEYREAISDKSREEKEELFRKLFEEEGRFTRPMICNDDRVQLYGFSEQAEEDLLRFLYNSERKIGDIAGPVLDGDKYIVAVYTGESKKGELSFYDLKSLLEYDLKRELISNRFALKLGKSTDLQEVSRRENIPIKQDELTFNSPMISDMYEPRVMGQVFLSNQKELIGPIKGKQGVYLVKIIDSKTDKVANPTEVINSEKFRRTSTLENAFIKALVERASICNNAVLHSLKIR